jgi:hypothetical protein
MVGQHAHNLSQAPIGFLNGNRGRAQRSQASWLRRLDEGHYARPAWKEQMEAALLNRSSRHRAEGHANATNDQ